MDPLKTDFLVALLSQGRSQQKLVHVFVSKRHGFKEMGALIKSAACINQGDVQLKIHHPGVTRSWVVFSPHPVAVDVT